MRAGQIGQLAVREPVRQAERAVALRGSEALDQIVVSPGLLAVASEADIVHGYADQLGAATDHDPVVVRFTLPAR